MKRLTALNKPFKYVGKKLLISFFTSSQVRDSPFETQLLVSSCKRMELDCMLLALATGIIGVTVMLFCSPLFQGAKNVSSNFSLSLSLFLFRHVFLQMGEQEHVLYNKCFWACNIVVIYFDGSTDRLQVCPYAGEWFHVYVYSCAMAGVHVLGCACICMCVCLHCTRVQLY